MIDNGRGAKGVVDANINNANINNPIRDFNGT